MKIYTDHKWKNFKYRNEVPQSVLTNDLDWTKEDDVDDGYIQYRGQWYHTSQFERVSRGMGAELNKWDGQHCDSFFSGILIRLSSDGEQYQIATYIA